MSLVCQIRGSCTNFLALLTEEFISAEVPSTEDTTDVELPSVSQHFLTKQPERLGWYPHPHLKQCSRSTVYARILFVGNPRLDQMLVFLIL